MDKELKQHADILINTTFITADSVSNMVRVSDRMVQMLGSQMDKEYKHILNDLHRHLTNAKVTTEKFDKRCADYLNMRDWDLMRLESNDLCRLILYYADRTCESMKYKHKMVEDFIKNMPSTGHLKDSFIEQNFTLR